MTTTLSTPAQLGKRRLSAVKLSFLLGLVVALCIFVPFLIVDKGFFRYAGDYNLQQMPFYMNVNRYLTEGGFGTWDWNTDLGSSIITSFSFYNIGSPFLWLSLIFPSSWMPYMMVPLFILKFACIAASASLYLSRYAKSRNMTVACSLMYAFCGFNIYNIFFNHMLDPVAIFPLMLWAMDAFVYDKRRGVFALLVGLALLDSYFFFIGNVVFLAIYFMVKLLMNEYRITGKEFGMLVLEAVIGVGIGMALAVPSLLTLLANPRTGNFSNGFNLIMYWEVQQYFAIFSSMFLPPDPPYWPNIFTEGAIKFTSMSAFLPVASMAGVIAYFKGRKKSAAKKMLIISLVMALVPFLNSMFFAFNASYYCRWYYMPILFMCFATLQSLEDERIDVVYGAKIALGITLGFVIFGLVPTLRDNKWQLGVQQDTAKFWFTFVVALAGIGVFYVLVRFCRHKVRFGPMLISAVMAFSVVYSVIHVSLGKFPQWDPDKNFRQEMYIGGQTLELPEDQFYRIDTYGMDDNFSLWADRPALKTFNSTVTPSLYEFYPFVGVTRDVASRPDHKLYSLRGLLGVRYMVMPQEKEKDFLEDEASRGYIYYDAQDTLVIYENQNYVPMGFTYDDYIDMSVLEEHYADEERGMVLMQAIGLDKEQIDTYGHLFNGGNKSTTLHFEGYERACTDRRSTASYDMQADKKGFVSHIKLDKPNLVFFAVPYDEGFSATVNGEEKEVLKVSGGLMAVEAPAGDNTIVFTYKTPGFRLGLAISAASIVLLVAYMLVIIKLRKEGKMPVANKMAYRPDGPLPRRKKMVADIKTNSVDIPLDDIEDELPNNVREETANENKDTELQIQQNVETKEAEDNTDKDTKKEQE